MTKILHIDTGPGARFRYELEDDTADDKKCERVYNIHIELF